MPKAFTNIRVQTFVAACPHCTVGLTGGRSHSLLLGYDDMEYAVDFKNGCLKCPGCNKMVKIPKKMLVLFGLE